MWFWSFQPVPHYGNQQQVIEERLTMYNAALLKSQMASDHSKVRRYTRQIKVTANLYSL